MLTNLVDCFIYLARYVWVSVIRRAHQSDLNIPQKPRSPQTRPFNCTICQELNTTDFLKDIPPWSIKCAWTSLQQTSHMQKDASTRHGGSKLSSNSFLNFSPPTNGATSLTFSSSCQEDIGRKSGSAIRATTTLKVISKQESRLHWQNDTITNTVPCSIRNIIPTEFCNSSSQNIQSCRQLLQIRIYRKLKPNSQESCKVNSELNDRNTNQTNQVCETRNKLNKPRLTHPHCTPRVGWIQCMIRLERSTLI